MFGKRAVVEILGRQARDVGVEHLQVGVSDLRPACGWIQRVSRNGGIRWHNHWVNVSHVLGEEYIAFEEIDDALWRVSFGPVALGRFHEALLRIEDQSGDLARTRRRSAPHL